MPFAGLQKVTADQLGRLQPKFYFAQASASLPASSTNADITGCSVTFDTLTNGAAYVVHAVFDMDPTGATTALITGFVDVDGVVGSAATYAGEVATDRSTVPQMWTGTLASAGSHTIKLKGTTPANAVIALTNTRILVTIYEVV